MRKILINESQDFPATCIQALSNIGEVYTEPGECSSKEIDTVFIRLQEYIGEQFHSRYPALQYIVTPTTGINHIDVEYFTSKNVKILSLKGHTDFLSNIHATAEHCIALALSLIRKLPLAVNDVIAGQWNRYPFKGEELYGKKIFLIGYGRLGQMVARLFEAFGCDVKAYDIDSKIVPPTISIGLIEGLRWADIVSVHVNLTDDSRGFLTADLLSEMKSTSFFINTARGELIDQKAIFTMITEGRIAGVALDVLWNEPSPFNQQIAHCIEKHPDKIIITPHIGGFTHESLRVVEEFITDVYCMTVTAG